METLRLSNDEAAASGFTHKAIITYADVAAIAGATTAGVIDLDTYTAGTAFTAAAYKVVTAFDGGSTSALSLDVGWNGGTTDDADGLIAAQEIHVDATEILYGLGDGAAFAANATGYIALDAGDLEATFTSTGANLSTLTAGEVHIYWRKTDFTKL
jgi:hypothetical protein